jgi:hypothetical protein
MCEDKMLNKMPVLNAIIEKKIEKMYLNNNQINIWPEKNYWGNFTKLIFISLLSNPICSRSSEIPGKIDILLTECASKYLKLFLKRMKQF